MNFNNFSKNNVLKANEIIRNNRGKIVYLLSLSESINYNSIICSLYKKIKLNKKCEFLLNIMQDYCFKDKSIMTIYDIVSCSGLFYLEPVKITER